MRNAFADELTKIAAIDERIVLLSGDIGNRLFDSYKQAYPTRFINCGIAEANMASVAAGLAMCGLRPITYTITPFNTTRCLEQIRDDICYHNVPVLIVGVGAGLSYASLGCTHHSCEDISFMRSIPNMSVLCPADSWELRALFRLALQQSGPVYLRIGKKGEASVHASMPDIQWGRAIEIQKGKDLCLLSTGNMLPSCCEVATHLSTIGIESKIMSFHTVKPLDIVTLRKIFEEYSLVISIEEHSLIGGFGASIAEWMIDQNIKTKFLRFGTRDEFPHDLGTQTFLRSYFHLNPLDIANSIQKHWESLCIQKQLF